MPRQVVFVSGAMTGLVNMNRKEFNKAQSYLEHYNHTVLNPAWFPDGLRHNDYLHMCFSMIDIADCIYVLRGSENSVGSKAEVTYAMNYGKGIYYQYETCENQVPETAKIT